MMSEFVLPRFIFCLIQDLREGYNEPGMLNESFFKSSPEDIFFFIAFREREREREWEKEGRKKNIDAREKHQFVTSWASRWDHGPQSGVTHANAQTGVEPAPSVCALTGNRAYNLLFTG